MMNLRSFHKELSQIREVALSKQSSNFVMTRTKKSNLKIQFQDGEVVILPMFKFRPHQLEVQIKLFIEGVKRFFLVRPRRSGKEVESWNLLVQASLETPGLYLMIYPTNVRARIVLWDGAIMLPNGNSLKFIDMIPKRFISNLNQQEMTIKLNNGSVIKVLGSDIDPDKLRGVNVRGAVFSEYAFSDPRVLNILMPVFRQNDGWFILQTTFNGMNHAYSYMKEVQDNPAWYCRIDSIETLVDENGDRYITDEMIEEDRKSGMPEYLIQQEYYSVVMANHEILYFSNEMAMVHNDGKLIDDLMIPNSRVRLFMDLGWNDTNTCVLAQFDHQINPYVIGYHECNNKPLEYYIRWAESFCIKRGLVLASDGVFAPHDGQKHDVGSGKNIVDFGQDLGYTVQIVPKPSSKMNAIQSSRRMLYRTKFNKQETHRLIECLSNYSKEFDSKKGVYKDSPLHNFASHGYDGFQTMVLAIEGDKINNNNIHRDIIYYNN